MTLSSAVLQYLFHWPRKSKVVDGLDNCSVWNGAEWLGILRKRTRKRRLMLLARREPQLALMLRMLLRAGPGGLLAKRTAGRVAHYDFMQPLQIIRLQVILGLPHQFAGPLLLSINDKIPFRADSNFLKVETISPLPCPSPRQKSRRAGRRPGQ